MSRLRTIKSFLEYINEGSSIDSDTSSYAEDVITKIKDINDTGDSYIEIRDLEYRDDNEFDIVIRIKKDKSPDFDTDSHFKTLQWEEINFNKYGFAIDANMNIDNYRLLIPEIIIDLIIDPSREPDLYKELRFKLIEILAHEINHTNQIGWNREPFNTRPSANATRNGVNTSYEYFILPEEVESMVLGMYIRSKSQNIPLDVLFDKYLTPFIENKKISNKEYSEVFKIWLKHALSNYPDALLSQNSPKIQQIVNSI